MAVGWMNRVWRVRGVGWVRRVGGMPRRPIVVRFVRERKISVAPIEFEPLVQAGKLSAGSVGFGAE
jgi:hypothetical protein